MQRATSRSRPFCNWARCCQGVLGSAATGPSAARRPALTGSGHGLALQDLANRLECASAPDVLKKGDNSKSCHTVCCHSFSASRLHVDLPSSASRRLLRPQFASTNQAAMKLNETTCTRSQRYAAAWRKGDALVLMLALPMGRSVPKLHHHPPTRQADGTYGRGLRGYAPR
jgi:hypothetical protein